ncbi:MAG: Gfo/Idh/MocA family oxidoreductase [Anaerolineae bacterium]|jgi:predicted dehydrogenase
MKDLRVGVIGCGYWGPNLIRNFVELSSANLVAVADLRADRREYINSRYPGVKTTDDYWDLFSMSLDAVVVATPPPTHFQIARTCLEKNLHVLVEKPLTLSSENALALIELAEERRLTLMVGHTFEYNAAVRALKDLVASGELGEIRYVDAVRVNLGLYQRDLDVVWDLAPHDISILLYLFDSDPVLVSAQGADCVFKGKHDIAYLNLEFPNGILAHVRLSWLDPCKVRRITVVGSRKMVVYDDVENLEKIRIYDKGVEAPPYTDTYADFQCSYRYGNVVIPNISFVEPLRVECEHFINCIARGNRPMSCGLTGLRVVRVLEAAERSLYSGGMPEAISWDGKVVRRGRPLGQPMLALEPEPVESLA